MKKKYILRLFFTIEIIIFGYFYYYGAHGLHAVQQLNAENAEITQQIVQLKDEIAVIDRQIVAWNEDPFYKEKIAREQLQMVAEGEEVYVL